MVLEGALVVFLLAGGDRDRKHVRARAGAFEAREDSLRAQEAPVLRMKPLAEASRAVEVSLIWMMRVTSLSAWMAT
jgi:hypothetical protein